MPAEILYCISQSEIKTPYTFHLTNIKVYSFEEALYHSYNYWIESFEDFISDEFIEWVRDVLGEKYLASKISNLKTIESSSDRLLAFLSLTDYYDRAQLAALRVELKEWEHRLEWERLKDMGDYLFKKGDAEKAFIYYKKALSYGDNIKVLNNAGICLMHTQNFAEAAAFLKRAYEIDKENFSVLINYAESLILSGNFEKAFVYLNKAGRISDNSIVNFLYGRLCFESNNPSEAINYYKMAAEAEYKPEYYYSLSKAYVKLRKYKEALDVLENIKEKDADFYINQANIHAVFTDYGAAVKSLEKAIVFGNKDNCELWVLLAKYHRHNYELTKASGAITKALNLDKNNKRALLEHAKIKKAQGKTRDYQLVLGDILSAFKKDYRRIHNI